MLNTISGAGKDKQGPLTKASRVEYAEDPRRHGPLTRGDSRVARKALRAWALGRDLAAPGGGAKTRAVREGGFGNNPVFVESHTTINLDGNQVARVVTKQQQRGRGETRSRSAGRSRIGGV